LAFCLAEPVIFLFSLLPFQSIFGVQFMGKKGLPSLKEQIKNELFAIHMGISLRNVAPGYERSRFF